MSKWRGNNKHHQSNRGSSMSESDAVVSKKETPKEATIEVATNFKKEEVNVKENPNSSSSTNATQYSVSPLIQLEMSLENYRDKITKLTDSEELAKTQIGFLRLLRSVLNTTNHEEVQTKWNAILNFANKHKTTAFNEYHMFKGAAAWTGSKTEYNILRHLAFLIIQTADPKTRRTNMRAINLEGILVNLNPNEKNALINLYG